MRILKTFSANGQSGKAKSKTHNKIKSCRSLCYYNLVQSSFAEKFRSLYKCVCPTFDMRHDLRSQLLYSKITISLINFVIFRTQYSWLVLILDRLHNQKYFPHRHRSTFIQGLAPYYHNSDDGKCAFSVNIKL